MKLLLKIAYDGSAYCGYQFQPDKPSVQRTLTEAFSSCFGFQCRITGCSRTDAGVHALGFCAAVEPADSEHDRITIPVGKLHRPLRRFLPDDISIMGEAEVEDDLHPRYSVIKKEYLYRMYDTPAYDPFENNRAWQLKKPIDDNGLRRMNDAASRLIGYHDFTSFMASGSRIEDAHRTVYSASVERKNNILELHISADGFLYNMVRIITGTLTDCAYGVYEPETVTDILNAKSRSSAGRTAPPCGLYLYEVTYDRKIDWKVE